MITSVVGEYHWLPTYIGSLFIDNEDHYGLTFWYEIVSDIKKEIDTINTISI